jgi:hypothetical protein
MPKNLVEKLREIHIQARVESLGVERLIDGVCELEHTFLKSVPAYMFL